MTFTTDDTICAISTPPGTGGIAVIRISGPRAITIADKIWKGQPLSQAATHTTHLGYITDTDGTTLDHCLATIFRAPKSFTGQDTVEISVHGSRYIQQQTLNTLCNAGARLAQPGEYSRRAFAAGRIDLPQAEAIADLIAANSRAAHHIAISQIKGQYSTRLRQLRDNLIDLASLLELELDFSEEDITFASRQKLLDLATDINNEVTRLHASFSAGNAIKQGIPVAIIGPTNAGKSSLLNRLLGDDRAIVSDIHGTTRDTVEEQINIGPYTFRLIDTAGLRHTTDTIEQLGINRSLDAARHALIILNIIDPLNPTPTPLPQNPQATTITILNKADLPHPAPANLPAGTITISALTGQGIPALLDRILAVADNRFHNTDDTIMVTNIRHAQSLADAITSTGRAIDALHRDLPADLVAQDIRLTIHHLSTIIGDIPASTLLTTIFSRFCIGK